MAKDGTPAEFDPAAMVVTYGLETPTGEVLAWSEVQERGLAGEYIDELGRIFASEQDMRAGRVLGYDVQLVIPGSRYPALVAREAAVSGVLGLLALAGTAMVVRRRRPA